MLFWAYASSLIRSVSLSALQNIMGGALVSKCKVIKRVIEIKDAACQAPLLWVNNDTLTSIRLNCWEAKGWVHTPSSCHLCLMKNREHPNSKMSKCFLKNHLHIECSYKQHNKSLCWNMWELQAEVKHTLDSYLNIITSGYWLLHAAPLPTNSHWLTRATSICFFSLCFFSLRCTVHILPRGYIT